MNARECLLTGEAAVRLEVELVRIWVDVGHKHGPDHTCVFGVCVVLLQLLLVLLVFMVSGLRKVVKQGKYRARR